MRLFVALTLPASVRDGLWEAAAPLRDGAFPVRWVPPDAIHVTVKFLGEVGVDDGPKVQAGLSGAVVGARALALTIARFGAFPTVDAPRIVWAGLDADPALELLHHEVERVFERLGFPPEGRPFRPHVTLGRATRAAQAADLAGLAQPLARLRYEATVRVESVELMESRPGATGMTYHVRHSERLP